MSEKELQTYFALAVHPIIIRDDELCSHSVNGRRQ